jgi:hypothetical protein
MSTETTDQTPTTDTRPWWVSWYASGAFTYHGPWWITGYAPDDEGSYSIRIICAAVMADSAHNAQQVIWDAHDDPADGFDGWRMTDPCEPGWEPFADRFPRAEWMRWPWPQVDAS